MVLSLPLLLSLPLAAALQLGPLPGAAPCYAHRHPIMCTSSSSVKQSRSLRLATVAADLVRVAQLQLDTFDPEPDAAEPAKPSLLGSLFGGPKPGAGGGRAARAGRLAVELEERVSKGSDIWVVVEPDGCSVIGTADLSEQELLLPTHGLDPDSLYLSSMAVDPAARRCGIGKELMLAALDRAADRGAEGVWLHVEKSNVPAIALYESGGFKKQPDSRMNAAFTSALNLQQKEPLLYYKSLA